MYRHNRQDWYNWAIELNLAQRLVQTEAALSECEGLRHQMQEELEIRKEVQKHQQNTTNLFVERTTQLQVQTAELEKRNLELDAFAHTVAHDLKNPLAVIISLTELLLEKASSNQPLDSQSLGFLEFVNKAGQQAFNTIDALLLLAGVSGKRQVTISSLKMSNIVANVIQQRLAHTINQSQAQIDLPHSWPVVQGYEPWVEQIWVNYMSNGIKYGGQPPYLQLGVDPETEGMRRFWVRDNGQGLTPEQQVQLFTPFTRLHKIRADGHGLGLSIVQQILEKLGGQAGVESVVGEGSLFYFTLPA
jgi:two-component system, sensor histidine kinase and response regulator